VSRPFSSCVSKVLQRMGRASHFLLTLQPVLARERVSNRISYMPTLTRQQVLDLYFMEARAKLIDVAAFLDRVDRASGPGDFRWTALRGALAELASEKSGRAERVLLALSDPTLEPLAAAPGKGAAGAWPGKSA